MNRENKRKQFQNGYYKNHRCDDTFTCKHCGRGGKAAVNACGAARLHGRVRAPRPTPNGITNRRASRTPPLCHAFYATSRLQIPTMWYTERKTLGGFHP